MAVLTGRAAVVKVCDTESGTYQNINTDSINPGSGWLTPVQMDISKHGDTAARSASSGFYDATLSCSGKYDPADAGMALVLANNPLWVQFAADGSTFKKCQMAWSMTTAHNAGSDAATFSLDFTPAGGTAPAAV